MAKNSAKVLSKFNCNIRKWLEEYDRKSFRRYKQFISIGFVYICLKYNSSWFCFKLIPKATMNT